MNPKEGADRDEIVPGMAELEIVVREALECGGGPAATGMHFDDDEATKLLRLPALLWSCEAGKSGRIDLEAQSERDALEKQFGDEKFTVHSDGLPVGKRPGRNLDVGQRHVGLGGADPEPLPPARDSADGLSVAQLAAYAVSIASDGVSALPLVEVRRLFSCVRVATLCGLVVESFGDSLGRLLHERKINGESLRLLRRGTVNCVTLEGVRDTLLQLRDHGLSGHERSRESSEPSAPAANRPEAIDPQDRAFARGKEQLGIEATDDCTEVRAVGRRFVFKVGREARFVRLLIERYGASVPSGVTVSELPDLLDSDADRMSPAQILEGNSALGVFVVNHRAKGRAYWMAMPAAEWKPRAAEGKATRRPKKRGEGTAGER